MKCSSWIIGSGLIVATAITTTLTESHDYLTGQVKLSEMAVATFDVRSVPITKYAVVNGALIIPSTALIRSLDRTGIYLKSGDSFHWEEVDILEKKDSDFLAVKPQNSILQTSEVVISGANFLRTIELNLKVENPQVGRKKSQND